MPNRRAVLSSLAGATILGGAAAAALGHETPLEVEEFNLVRPPYEEWPAPAPDSAAAFEPAEAMKLSLRYPDGTNGLVNARVLLKLAQCIYYSDGKAKRTYRVAADRFAGKLDDLVRRTNLNGEPEEFWLPYTAKREMHDNPNLLQSPPWVSGMAQGEALSAYIRLAHLTGRDYYRNHADRVFQTLRADRGTPAAARPWATMIDSSGYYWIEEWPRPVPGHTLNGKLFAMFGLYEYWLVTGNREARRLFEAACTTIKDYIWQYRVPDDISYYCLEHKAQNDKYHQIHIEELLNLHRVTGEKTFREAAETFKNDWWSSEE